MNEQSDWEKNPKMQPGIKQKLRTWQFPQGDYHYGECPNCGEIGDSQFDSDDEEGFLCESCGCEYFYETTEVYRYAGLDPDWRPSDGATTTDGAS